jgi:hypothetical protein
MLKRKFFYVGKRKWFTNLRKLNRRRCNACPNIFRYCIENFTSSIVNLTFLYHFTRHKKIEARISNTAIGGHFSAVNERSINLDVNLKGSYSILYTTCFLYENYTKKREEQVEVIYMLD